jgi:hypothetical protein
MRSSGKAVFFRNRRARFLPVVQSIGPKSGIRFSENPVLNKGIEGQYASITTHGDLMIF